jgi:hypothetical protein
MGQRAEGKGQEVKKVRRLEIRKEEKELYANETN